MDLKEALALYRYEHRNPDPIQPAHYTAIRRVQNVLCVCGHQGRAHRTIERNCPLGCYAVDVNDLTVCPCDGFATTTWPV